MSGNYLNTNVSAFVERLMDPAVPRDDYELAVLYDLLPPSYRKSDGVSWYEGWVGKHRAPAIMRCEHPGNYLNRPCYSLVATFTSLAEMRRVLATFSEYEREIAMPKLAGECAELAV